MTKKTSKVVIDGIAYDIEDSITKNNLEKEIVRSEKQDNLLWEKVEILDSGLQNLTHTVNTHNKAILLFCIEPVTIMVGTKEIICNAGEYSTVFVGDDEFAIVPTSNKSIKILSGYPIPLKWHDWMEGVDVFSNIIFDMNELETYYHWNQGYQAQFHVQEAQYINCIFWSDRAYVQTPLEERTNYTLYNSAELPLCYSSIRENTYKPFYFAYGVTKDPNWSNDDYLYSFSLTTVATQPFSYYGARTIGVFNSANKPIPLPKDCRGLLFYSPVIESIGVLDATNVTNFGAKSGSWREAFGTCSGLKNLYIRNLKVSLNLSWSPINLESITYIINNAANTSAITISLSPYTWNLLTDSLKSTASGKNITLALISTNMPEDNRLNKLVMTGDGTKFLSNNGTYKNLTEDTALKNYIAEEISKALGK